MAETLAQTILSAQPYVNWVSLTLGTNGDPAVRAANIVKQTMLSAPFKWRWNRTTVPFNTTAYSQDYDEAGLTTFGFMEFASVQKTAAITAAVLTNNVATYTSPNTFAYGDIVGITGCTTSTFNVKPATIASATSSSFTVNITHGNIGSENETGVAALLAYADGAPGIMPLQISNAAMGEGTEIGSPRFISTQLDDGGGDITFRLLPVPNQQNLVTVTYQQAATLFAATTDNWDPIPGWMSYIYFYGFLSLILDYFDNPGMAQKYRQLFVTNLLAVAEGLTETEENIFRARWLGNNVQDQATSLRTQISGQSRSI